MELSTYKKFGKVGVEFRVNDGNGIRVSKDLLEHLFYNIVEKSAKYYDETGDHVFIYREKQLHSVVCPSIEKLTPSFLFEHPLTRKNAGEEAYLGHADYWISYRNYEYLLELKHAYFAYKRVNNPRKGIESKFKDAIKQLKSVPKRECVSLQINKGLVKIALEAIVFYERSRRGISKEWDKSRDFPLIFEQMLENTGLMDRVNFYSLWVLDKGFVKPVEYLDCTEIYPALGFIGQISLATK